MLRTNAFCCAVFLLSAGIAFAQRPGMGGGEHGSTTPANQPVGNITVEGCVIGRGGDWELTDKQSRITFLLHGNNQMLSALNGKQVEIVGHATYITPSNVPGKPGYINPGESSSSGAGNANGAKKRNLAVQNTRVVADNCSGDPQASSRPAGTAQVSNGTTGLMPQIGAPTALSEHNNVAGCLYHTHDGFKLDDGSTVRIYNIHSTTQDLASYTNRVVLVSGDLARYHSGPNPVLNARQVQDMGRVCDPNEFAFENLPVTGKTGNQGTMENVTTTNARGTTPGVAVNSNQVSAAPNENYEAGAPDTFEGAGQGTYSANRMATGAERTEVGAPSGTYGVNNVAPNYALSGNATAAQNTTQTGTQSKQPRSNLRKPPQPPQ